jgi:transcriptional regulator with XRE-family HTH domain
MTETSLGEYIRNQRDRLNISLRELARRINVTPPFLSDIELGRRFPSEETLTALATEFGITFDEIRNFDPRASLTDFKKLVESNPELRLAFRTRMREVKSGKISPEDLAQILSRGGHKK